MLTVYPRRIYADSTGALIVVSGLPNRAVTWQLTGGAGTLTPINTYTDAQGRAAARFVPAGAGVVTVQASYGA